MRGAGWRRRRGIDFLSMRRRPRFMRFSRRKTLSGLGEPAFSKTLRFEKSGVFEKPRKLLALERRGSSAFSRSACAGRRPQRKLVTIDLGRVMDSDETKFRVSHAIKTPMQIAPYRTSIPVADYPAYALHKAITGLTDYYRDAVKNGHKPSEQWLVKN